MSLAGPVGAFYSSGTGFSVPLTDVVDAFGLELATPTIDIKKKVLTQADINRPALQLAGFYDYFDSTRLQVVGRVEQSYLLNLPSDVRLINLERLFSHRIPALILCWNMDVFPEMHDLAIKYDVPILSTQIETMDFLGELIKWMKVQLAPRKTMHGCLLDVYGVGTLIVGESGVGKSETALELIKRGHRFIADDAVEIRRVSSETLIGSCPENIKYFLELRGIGIIDVMQMFGVQSIKPTQSVELLINLELWDSSKIYDRLGRDEEFTEILGNKINSHSIPIRPGRNLSILCESAAINHRQRKMGYNAAAFLTDRIMKKRSMFE